MSDEYPYTRGNAGRLRGLKPAPPEPDAGETKAQFTWNTLCFVIAMLGGAFIWVGIIRSFKWALALFTGD